MRFSADLPEAVLGLAEATEQLGDFAAAISGYLAHSRGVRCHPGQVLVLTSSQQCLQLLAQMLLDDGDVRRVGLRPQRGQIGLGLDLELHLLLGQAAGQCELLGDDGRRRLPQPRQHGRAV